ncbi:MAG TPA: hypothetical protein VHE55_11085 [Fimbriimonadaceae bacterium]|nr:hypothetical protein [Fimbriimonadaceae bacterium]
MATYHGLALTLGASSSSLPDPHAVPGLSLWLDAGDRSTLWKDTFMVNPVTQDGDPVGLWKDKSGNGFNFLNVNLSQQPTYKTGIMGSEAAILGDGSKTYLHNSTCNIATTTGITIYVVIKAVATSSFQSVFSAYAGAGTATTTPDGWDFETWTSSRWLLDRFDTDTDGLLLSKTAASSDFTQSQIIACSIDLGAGVGKIWVNGGTSSSDTMSDRTHINPTAMRIFARVDSAVEYFGGYLSQVLAYAGPHSTNQVNQILQYLSFRSSIPVAMAT